MFLKLKININDPWVWVEKCSSNPHPSIVLFPFLASFSWHHSYFANSPTQHATQDSPVVSSILFSSSLFSVLYIFVDNTSFTYHFMIGPLCSNVIKKCSLIIIILFLLLCKTLSPRRLGFLTLVRNCGIHLNFLCTFNLICYPLFTQAPL